jgi:FAD/FMN-containing dehydrogenase
VNLTRELDNKLKLPFSGNYYCLIELTNFLDIKNFNNFIIDKFSEISFKGMKIIIAKSESENQLFWRIREEIPLAEKLLKNVIQHDVSLPLNFIDKFIKKSSSSLKKLDSKISIINFGHLGDNNLHFNVFIDKILERKEYKKIQKDINKIVFSNVVKFNGSISAEHGIGQLRRKELKKFKSADEIKKMIQIKKIFDPKGIMNPGKII